MSKLNGGVPTLGQPVFRISENSLEERVNIAGERGLLNTLVYFAHDGVLVKSQRYLDDKLTKIIINEGMVTDDEEKESLEMILDLEKNSSREPDADTIYTNEAEAAAIAKKMNENQKKQCRKLLDLANKAYNTYDEIIAACSVK